MSKVRIYSGSVRNGLWYNHADIEPLKGGVLAMLDGGDKTGAARLLNLLKGSVTKLYTDNMDELILKDQDYLDIKIIDAWKMAYEQIKLVTKSDYPIIPEYFYCSRCSRPGYEHYTDVNESWQKLIDEGKIDEIYLNEPQDTWIVNLPDPIEIKAMKTVAGGVFDQIEMRFLTVGDMIKIQNNPDSMASEAALIYATWDVQIIGIPKLSDRDFNIIKRASNDFFSKTYLVTKDNQDAIIQAEREHSIGVNASARSIMCKNCGNEIGGTLDQTNFFSPLLPKR
jgi:hypothetical protein